MMMGCAKLDPAPMSSCAAAERGKSKETAVSIATAPALRRFNMPNPSKLQDSFHV
jgi:hypothetical protein